MIKLNINVLFLLLLSGTLAYIGDYIGRRLGKMRIVIFGLRPKATAIIISILTGMLTTFIILVILTNISDEARIALLESRDIKNERDALKLEYERALKVLRELNESKEKLNAEIVSLSKTIEIKKRERIAFNPDELLDFVVISNYDTNENNIDNFKLECEKKFILMIERVKTLASEFGIKTRSTDEIWKQLKEPLLSTVSKLKAGEMLVVYLKTTHRVMEGEYLEDVKVQAERNRIIYKKGDVIDIDEWINSKNTSEVESYSIIDGAKSRENIKIELINYLSLVREKVKADGMIIEPFTNFDSITLHDIINEIKRFDCKIRLIIEITDDVTIVGPFAFRIKFFKV